MTTLDWFDWLSLGIYSAAMLALFIIFTIIWRKLK